jgi:hypothetical protein
MTDPLPFLLAGSFDSPVTCLRVAASAKAGEREVRGGEINIRRLEWTPWQLKKMKHHQSMKGGKK